MRKGPPAKAGGPCEDRALSPLMRAAVCPWHRQSLAAGDAGSDVPGTEPASDLGRVPHHLGPARLDQQPRPLDQGKVVAGITRPAGSRR